MRTNPRIWTMSWVIVGALLLASPPALLAKGRHGAKPAPGHTQPVITHAGSSAPHVVLPPARVRLPCVLEIERRLDAIATRAAAAQMELDRVERRLARLAGKLPTPKVRARRHVLHQRADALRMELVGLRAEAMMLRHRLYARR